MKFHGSILPICQPFFQCSLVVIKPSAFRTYSLTLMYNMYYINKFIDRCAWDHVDKTDNFGGNANNGHKHNIKPTRYVTILYYIAINSYLQFSHLGFKVISKESTSIC